MIIVGKLIYEILSNNSELNSYVDKRIYPIVAPENTPLPLIVYTRNSNPEHNKDTKSIYTTDVDITIISSDYKTSIEISEVIDGILNLFSGEVLNKKIFKIETIGVEEDYDDGMFTQTISYSIKSN